MKDMISREAAIDAIDKNRQDLLSIGMDGAEHILVHYGRRVIEELPSAERVGKWIPCAKNGIELTEMMRREGQKWYGYKCSNCGSIYKGNALTQSPFCQKCGARMEGEEDEADA